MFNLVRRRSLLSLLALPAACSLHPLAPLERRLLHASPTTPARICAIGQSWTYKVFNAYNGEVWDTVKESISIAGTTITVLRHAEKRGELAPEKHSDWGLLLQESTWDEALVYAQAMPLWPKNLALDSREVAETHYTTGQASFHHQISAYCRIQSFEQVHVPAGVFDTVRIERRIRLMQIDVNRPKCERTDTLWLAPSIGRWVARETDGICLNPGRRAGQREDHLRWELEHWT